MKFRWLFLVWAGWFAAVLSFWSCDQERCHRGHEAVLYHPMWIQDLPQTHMVGKTVIVTHIFITHPAHCEMQWVCDVRCSDLDAGRNEAHLTHSPIKDPMWVDPKCLEPNMHW